MNQGEFKTGCFLRDGVCPRNARTVTSLYFGEGDAIRGLIDGAFDPDLVVGDGFRVTARSEGQITGPNGPLLCSYVPTGRLRGDAGDGAPEGPIFEEEAVSPEVQAAVATR